MHLAPRAKLTTAALTFALNLALACGGTTSEPGASQSDRDSGSDAAECPTPAKGDPATGQIGCGSITCDVGKAPICLIRTPYTGDCHTAECVAVPSECASDVSCNCLMRIPSTPSEGDGGTVLDSGTFDLGGGDVFCGTGRGSYRHCDENGSGIRVHCSGI